MKVRSAALRGVNDPLGASHRLVEMLGSGAVGQVWRIGSTQSREVFAAKILRSGLTENDHLLLTLQESKVPTALQRPNIVEVRDLVLEGQTLTIIMELVKEDHLRNSLISTVRYQQP